jgi:hypothetical protein
MVTGLLRLRPDFAHQKSLKLFFNIGAVGSHRQAGKQQGCNNHQNPLCLAHLFHSVSSRSALAN